MLLVMDPAKPARSHLPLVVALCAAVAAAFGSSGAMVGTIWYFERISATDVPEAIAAEQSCNVLGIQIHGSLVSSRSDIPVSDVIPTNDGSHVLLAPNYTVASDVRYYLDAAVSDPAIKALLIDVNSYGGYAGAGEEIARAIHAFGKPSVAVVHSWGQSAGYLAAASAEKIYALKSSSVGSIGATLSYTSEVEKNKKDGIEYVQLSSGPFKDGLSSDKKLSDAERALAMRDVTILRDDFVEWVALYRNQSKEKIDKLADGSTMLGEQALQNGLIDEIGGILEASEYLSSKIGEEASICWR